MSSANIVDMLIVEDTSQDLTLALRALGKANLISRIMSARDGEEAIEFIFCEGTFSDRKIEDGPKVVLLDLKLPKIDGLEVLRRMRTDSRTKHIPVVILTSSAQQRDILGSYSLGANSYVVKPVNSEEFAQAVRTLGMYWLTLNQPPPPRV